MIIKFGKLKQLIRESRPTPIDKPAIREYVDQLTDEIYAAMDGLEQEEPVGVHARLVKSRFHTRDVKTGEEIEFPVIIRTGEGLGMQNVFLDAGAGTVKGMFFVMVEINGDYSPYRYHHDMAYHLKKVLYEALIHELTHAADQRYDTRPSNVAPKYWNKSMGGIDRKKYYNDPRELRAFIQEAVEEALERARSRKGESFESVFEFATSGQTISLLKRNLTSKNFNKVLKTIAAELQREGYA